MPNDYRRVDSSEVNQQQKGLRKIAALVQAEVLDHASIDQLSDLFYEMDRPSFNLHTFSFFIGWMYDFDDDYETLRNFSNEQRQQHYLSSINESHKVTRSICVLVRLLISKSISVKEFADHVITKKMAKKYVSEVLNEQFRREARTAVRLLQQGSRSGPRHMRNFPDDLIGNVAFMLSSGDEKSKKEIENEVTKSSFEHASFRLFTSMKRGNPADKTQADPYGPGAMVVYKKK